MSALSPDCATALGEAAASALQQQPSHLALAHCVRDGMVQTYDVLALPTSSRWGGTLVGIYVNERGAAVQSARRDLSTTDDGVLSLATLRDARRKPFDFQIVHHNKAASRAAEGAGGRACSGAGSAKAAICFARPKSIERLLEVVSQRQRAISSRSTAMTAT